MVYGIWYMLSNRPCGRLFNDWSSIGVILNVGILSFKYT